MRNILNHDLFLENFRVLAVNFTMDDKRFWLGRLENINDSKKNNSTSLNPEFFAERFELNDDFRA